MRSFTRHVVDRLLTAGLVGVLIVLVSAPVTIRTGAADSMADRAGGADHSARLLMAHLRYAAVRVDGRSIGFDVTLIAELAGVLALIAVTIAWVEHRHTASPGGGGRPGSRDR
jgi:hypothetical protein